MVSLSPGEIHRAHPITLPRSLPATIAENGNPWTKDCLLAPRNSVHGSGRMAEAQHWHNVLKSKEIIIASTIIGNNYGSGKDRVYFERAFQPGIRSAKDSKATADIMTTMRPRSLERQQRTR